MPQRWIIGLASGSAADGVDAALLDLAGVGLELRVRQMDGLHQPYPAELRDLLRRIATGAVCPARQLGQAHRVLGETFAAAARAVADRASCSLLKVQCVGCPGHAVWRDGEARLPAVLELGMAAVVAERCGVTVVSGFRDRDLAAGGQGGPLAALTDHLLFRHATEGRLILHLGGVARAVYLPPGGKPHEVQALEAGPCNLLLDALVRELTGGREAYDAGGKHAVQGRCLEPLVQAWLAHPDLQRRPPRTLSRQTHGPEFVSQAVQQARQHGGNLHDLLCTATHFVARGITAAVRRHLPVERVERVLLSGGGVRNGLLWHLLEQQLGCHGALARTDEAGVPAGLLQAAAFGLLAALTLDGVPGNAPAATGAAGSRLLGSLTPGSSASWSRCLAWMASQCAPVAVLS
jgi:anhydro-N-acetylmuramic acid kinase